MKPTALLTIAIFLVCAPSPDSNTITEISSGFLAPANVEPLLADKTSSVEPAVPALEISEDNMALDKG